jgi:hypothetical protein
MLRDPDMGKLCCACIFGGCGGIRTTMRERERERERERQRKGEREIPAQRPCQCCHPSKTLSLRAIEGREREREPEREGERY